MVYNGVPMVITTRVMHLMANGMAKAPINGGMGRCMKEVGTKVNEMVKVQLHTKMENHM